jgi:predicted ATPase
MERPPRYDPIELECIMSPGFSRLSVHGYRRLKKIDIALRPLNVLIGANGVGKSSFLDVFDLLAASAEGTLQSSQSATGPISSIDPGR